MKEKIKTYLGLVKFSHTIFAMPFAIIGFFTATQLYTYPFQTLLLLYVVLCMIFARNSAMGFNRYIDRSIDAKNNRTAIREIPAGKIKPNAALIFILANIAAFIATTYFINPICFYLSPVALIVILGYSLTKRFTALCHFVLGVGLSLAPIGAFLAVSGKFAMLPILISALVLLWTGGFDIIYALQDEQFDKQNKLFSIPSKIGIRNALILSGIVHGLVVCLVVAIGIAGNLNWLYWIGSCLFTTLLVYQHIIVKPSDLSKINLAFGTTNGIASVLFGITTVTSFFI